MIKIAQHTLVIALFLALVTGCSQDNSGSKKLKDMKQSGEVDPGLIKDNRSAGQDNSDNPEPAFEFNTTEWNFGTIKDGMRPTYIFKYTNVGDADLIISGCEASCGCTIPEWTKKPVPPGGKGEIHVAFNSTGKHGSQHKTITVTANTNPPQTILKVSGNVEKK